MTPFCIWLKSFEQNDKRRYDYKYNSDFLVIGGVYYCANDMTKNVRYISATGVDLVPANQKWYASTRKPPRQQQILKATFVSLIDRN